MKEGFEVVVANCVPCHSVKPLKDIQWYFLTEE